ncbi:hypothetical protein [Actinomadura sp. 3N508]|uniref:hypothetical protein n=1 Tax=Actinomadura sp. 3N508 TaxID=3375153 RepID=UPI00379F9C61
MFTNPLDAMFQQGMWGCGFIVVGLAVLAVVVKLIVELLPWLVVGVALYVAYRVVRFVLKRRQREAR